MTETVNIAPIPSPIAWRADEMRGSARWIYELSKSDIANIEHGLEHVKRRGLGIPYGAEDFPIGDLAGRIAVNQHGGQAGRRSALGD